MRAGLKRLGVVRAAILGAALGFFALHPYTMFVYGVFEAPHEETTTGFSHVLWHVRQVIYTFEPGMLHMGIPYAVVGAVAGLFFGLWMEAERQRVEVEKRITAADTLKELMVTLSHYLLNACMVIGGYAERSIRKSDDDDMKRRLGVIKDEARQIEDVVKSLQSVDAVVSESYSNAGETKMIDIRRQLERMIEERKKTQGEKPGNNNGKGGSI